LTSSGTNLSTASDTGPECETFKVI
jgi:hypothetical protein